MPLSPGDRFGRYRIDAAIGRGGMGEVYAAEDEVLRRKVALKILHAAGDGTARLLREARAAAAIDHPNAVRIFDVGEEDGVAFMAMELLSGKSLRAVAGDRSISTDTKLARLLDVARALAAAHARGVVHRDVKPENVLVRDDGIVKVLDFGIARRDPRRIDPGADTQLVGSTTTEHVEESAVGTLAYMAPEQLRGDPTTDARADQWAWAVVAYELFEGRLPWGTTHGALEVASQILTRDVEAPASAPPAVAEVVSRALRKRPEERWASMDEIVQRLAPAPVRDEPPRAGAEAASPRARRVPRGSVAAAIAAVAIGASALAWWWSKPTTGAPAAAGRAATSAALPPAALPPYYGSPPSPHPSARVAYEEGIQALRDANKAAARKALERAREIDPSFGAAHLRSLFALPSLQDARSRDRYAAARGLRATLGDHDRALVDALEPWLASTLDAPSLAHRLDALPADDADDQYVACIAWLSVGEFERAAEACKRAIAVDPTLAAAMEWRAVALQRLGDTAAARSEYESCSRASPSAASCWQGLSVIDTEEGRCAEAEHEERQARAMRPAEGSPSLMLLVVSIGAGDEAYETALGQYLAALPEASRVAAEEEARAELDLFRGRLTGAEAHAKRWRAALWSSTSDLDHWWASEVSAELELELGHAREAAAIAEAYLTAREAGSWVAFQDVDFRIGARGLAYQSGASSRRDFVAARDRYLEKSPATSSKTGAAERWVLAYCFALVGDDDVRDALAAMEGLDLAALDKLDQECVGEVLARAGRVAESRAWYERAALDCRWTRSPLQHTRAVLGLARALVAAGETEEACRWLATLPAWPTTSVSGRSRADLAARSRCTR